ncbi:hypothetical protein [Streptomyces sp. NPDC007088]|uniref:protein kinase domain-containing protein n=1 Tax=Streptomyces sp. NPDC007088 TaxID=3364773 RepID=UPI0036B0DF51
MPVHPVLPDTGLSLAAPPRLAYVQEASAVWQATLDDGRVLAIKSGWAYTHTTAWTRWAPRREAEVLRALGDDAPVLHGCTTTGTWCARPWRAGTTLQDAACHGEQALATAAAGAARALDALHARGVIHRDFAPDHALQGPDGTTHLIDLALAAGDFPFSPSATFSFSFPGGNPRYESPELAGAAPATVASDTWAWAASVYRAATGGTTLTDAPDPMTPAARLHYRQATAAGHRRRPLPGPLGQVLEGALHPDPCRRLPLAVLADQLDARLRETA